MYRLYGKKDKGKSQGKVSVTPKLARVIYLFSRHTVYYHKRWMVKQSKRNRLLVPPMLSWNSLELSLKLVLGQLILRTAGCGFGDKLVGK